MAAHLHVITPCSPRWHLQIEFRETLRSAPTLTADYAALKHVLAATHTGDREAYTAAKSDSIRTVLDRST